MGVYYAAPLLGPSLGPLLGGVLTQIFSWRATFYFLAIFGGVSLTTFAFFKGLNDEAVNGVLTADVTDGLSAGVNKISTINSSLNYRPAPVAVAQHGSLDDMVYVCIL